ARQGWACSVAKRELDHLEYVGSPVVQGILVAGRRDVLGGQPDAEAGGVDLGEGVVTPASFVELDVREALVRVCSRGHGADPVRAQDGVGRARVDRLA